jgi:hypothetical protein
VGVVENDRLRIITPRVGVKKRLVRGDCDRMTDRLEAIVRERKAFDRARRRALARLREGLDLQWTPPRSRMSSMSDNYFVDTNSPH